MSTHHHDDQGLDIVGHGNAVPALWNKVQRQRPGDGVRVFPASGRNMRRVSRPAELTLVHPKIWCTSSTSSSAIMLKITLATFPGRAALMTFFSKMLSGSPWASKPPCWLARKVLVTTERCLDAQPDTPSWLGMPATPRLRDVAAAWTEAACSWADLVLASTW